MTSTHFHSAVTRNFAIAIVEDDDVLRDGMATWVSEMGYTPTVFSTAGALLKAMRATKFSLLMLDWGLPDMQGIDLVRQLRANEKIDAPIILCTARGGETEVVEALHDGADDFIVKPVRRNELAARISVTLRRAYPVTADSGQLSIPPYSIDLANREISIGNRRVELQNREYALAVMLFQNLNGVVSRTRIVQTLWGGEPVETSRSLDTHISRVRRKLDISPERGLILQSVYGVGYRLQTVAAPEQV